MNMHVLASVPASLEAFGLAWRYVTAVLQFLIDQGSKVTSAGGGPSVGAMTALTTLLMGAYAAMKSIDILGKAEGGMAARLEAGWHASRKGMIVYALSVAAPLLAMGLGSLAISNVQKAAKVIPDAVGDVLTGFDKLLSSGGSLFVTAPVSAMNAFGLQNSILDANKAKALAVKAGNNLPGMLGVFDMNAATLAQLRKIAIKQGGVTTNVDAAMGQQRAALQSASTTWTAACTAGAEKESTWNHVKTKLGNIADGISASVVETPAGGMMDAALANFKLDFMDGLKYVGCYAAGWVLASIALLGIAGGGMAVLKEGFGAIAYLLGVVVAMSIGTAVAIPFAGLFMLSFLSEKTEAYGRNFVSFLFSMVFASIGLLAAAKVVAGFLTLVGSVGLNAAGLLMGKICVGDGNIVGAAFGCAGVALGIGMFTSFIIEILKRGGAIGAGFWSGSLQV